MNIPTIYVDKLCDQAKETCDDASPGGEDSSYDSDFEGEDPKSHPDVSRTVSDTLAAEFSEYVSEFGTTASNYSAKVEFALKLGYTEKNFQAALCKLGPDPSQNELLAELIKLGAQSSRTAECDAEIPDVPVTLEESSSGLRHIVVDGSNVAMAHGNKDVFSCRGIKLCVDWFKNRGHKEITVFVPKWRKEASRPDNLIADQEILTELEKEKIVVFTPSRLVGGKRTVCYDDRYIIRLAVEVDGIVVSNDNYRDLALESLEFRRVIEERTLMYSFVNDRFMPPDDPLGRLGPTLDNFLRIQPKKNDPPPPCPYGKKCTYGNKCKYHHPERGSMPHKSVTERLFEHAQKHWQARGSRESQVRVKSLSVPLGTDDQSRQAGISRKIPLSRTKSGNPMTSSSRHLESDCVAKSKSVENISNEKVFPHGSRCNSAYWKAVKKDRDRPHSLLPNQGMCHAGLGQRLSDPGSVSCERAGNLHRKLERQLTLNPYEWTWTKAKRGHPAGVLKDSPYREHKNVTRISSAPGSCQPVPPHPSSQTKLMHRKSSISDSSINLCVPESSFLPNGREGKAWVPKAPSGAETCPANPALRVPPSASQVESRFETRSDFEEARKKLHYHLSSIFPEEQVRAVLRLYPNETKPQEICAAILAMFADN